jgi:uncharacterized membrane protein
VTVLSLLLTLVHVLAGAAWFGAMFYSLTVLQPRAMLWFGKPERFEEFIAAVSHGARSKVLAAFGLMALTGAGLTATAWRQPASTAWLALIGAKVVLLAAALAVFVHTSWRLWPARVLALPEEIPGLQRKFRRVGWTMIGLVGLSMALGVTARHF